MTDGLVLFRKAQDFAAQAARALSEAKSVVEVKNIRAWGKAAQEFAKQSKDRGLMADAWEVIIRSERKLGELIRAQKESVGLNQGAVRGKTGTKAAPVLDARPTLADAGIDKKLSSRSQSWAKKSEEEFEEDVHEIRAEVLIAAEKATGTGSLPATQLNLRPWEDQQLGILYIDKDRPPPSEEEMERRLARDRALQRWHTDPSIKMDFETYWATLQKKLVAE